MPRAIDEQSDVPTLKRRKYRSRQGGKFRRRAIWWAKLLLMIYACIWIADRTYSFIRGPKAAKANAAQQNPVAAAPQAAVHPVQRPQDAEANPAAARPANGTGTFVVSPFKTTTPAVQPPQAPSVSSPPGQATPQVANPGLNNAARFPAPQPDSIPDAIPQPGLGPGQMPQPGLVHGQMPQHGLMPGGIVHPGAMPRHALVPQPQFAAPAGRLMAVRGGPAMPHIGPYSKDDPPAVDDIVMVLFAGPRAVGKVASVNAQADECKIKVLDARTYDLYGKVHETGKTRTVRLEQLRLHPRMHFRQHAAPRLTGPDPSQTDSSDP